MAAPTYRANGGIAYGASTSVAVPYPTLSADNILIIQLISNDGSGDHAQPTGFAAINTQTVQSTNATCSWWWKRATGSESGTLSCTRAGATGDGFWGVMSSWAGAVTTGTPFNTVSTQTNRNTSALSTAITPSYNDARIICLLQVEDNLGNGTFNGGNFAEDFDLPDGSTTDAEISVCSFGQTTAAEEPQRTATIGGTDSWSTCTLALWSTTATVRHLAATSAAVTTTASASLSNAKHLSATVAAVTTSAAATLTAGSTIHFAATAAAETSTGGGASKNLWPNADLEAGVDDWNNAYNCPISQSSVQAQQGTYSLRGDDGGWGSIKSDVKYIVSPSTQYAASWYVYPVTTAFTPNGYIYDQDDNVLTSGSMGLCPANTWTRVSRIFTTGAGDTGIALYMETGNGTAKVFYVDAVQVELGGSVTDWENYSAGGGAALTISDHFSAVSTVTTTTAAPTLALAKHLTAAVAAVTSTGAAALNVPKHFAGTSTAVTATAAPALALAKHLAQTIAAVTATADASLTITGAVHFASAVEVVTTTAPVTLGVVRHFGSAATTITTTASATLIISGIYYVRADGTAANKAAATSDADASTSMSVATHNSQTFSPGDTIIVSDAGGVYRGTMLNIPSSGSAGAPVTYLASGSPVLKGSKDISTASYSWTASGSGTNEYYLRTSGGGNPSIYEPDDVYIDDVVSEVGTLGSLADHEWDWGDNDSLGYSTVYIRDNSGNPDTSGVLIEANQIGTVLLQAKSYVTFDGIDIKHASLADGQYIGAVRMEEVTTTNHIIIKNVDVTWCATGITLKGDYNELDNCTASYCRGHSLSIGGGADRHALYNTIKNCVVNHSRPDFGGFANNYGLKILYGDYSEIYGNEVYDCGLGIDLDGDMNDHEHGSNYNNIYDNYFHDNDTVGIHLEWWCHDNRIYRNLCWNNGRTGTSVDNDEIRESFAGDATYNSNNEYFYNVCGKTSGGSGDATPDRMIDVAYGAKVYGNVLYGGDVCVHAICIDGGSNPHPENCKIKNNIVVGFTSSCMAYSGSSFTGLEIDYNCYRRSDAGANVIERQYGGISIATHYSSYGQDQHSLNSDPQFKGVADDKFWIERSSPCVDAGTNLGATYDDGLNRASAWPSSIITVDQDSFGAGWEIGAYVSDFAEFAATVAAASTTAAASLAIADHLSAAIAAASTTAAAALANAKHLSTTAAAATTTAAASLTITGVVHFASTAAATSTTAAAPLLLAKHLAPDLDIVTTSANGQLVIGRPLAATVAAATSTGSAALTIGKHFACTSAAATTTAGAALTLAKHLAPTSAAVTTTGAAVLNVPKHFAATQAATSTTAGAALSSAKHLAPVVSAETATAAGALAVTRHLPATSAAASTTASATLSVTGQASFAATAAAVSTTAAAGLSVVRHLDSALDTVSATGAAILNVPAHFAGTIAGTSVAATPVLNAGRHLATTAAAVTSAANASLSVADHVSFSAVAAASTTTAASALTLAKHLAPAVAAATVAGAAVCWVTRHLAAATAATSTTAAANLTQTIHLAGTVAAATTTGAADLVSGKLLTATVAAATATGAAVLANAKHLAPTMAAVSDTAAAVLTAIRDLSAAVNAATATADPMLWRLQSKAATMAAATSTSAAQMVLGVLGDIDTPTIESLTAELLIESMTTKFTWSSVTEVREILSM